MDMHPQAKFLATPLVNSEAYYLAANLKIRLESKVIWPLGRGRTREPPVGLDMLTM